MRNAFYLKKGRTVHNLEELAVAFKTMDSEEFNHHVSKEKNDFASWIRHSLNNADLADKISNLKTINSVRLELEKNIKSNSSEKVNPTESKTTRPEFELKSAPETNLKNAERKFDLKEFLMGVAIGLLLGVIIMALISGAVGP